MTRTPATKSPRSATSRRRTRRKRDDEVVAAAAKVFYERGYSAATVQDIADELGILKGSLYHYIKTKEDLLFRLFEQVHEEVEGILEEVTALEGIDPLERIRVYVHRQLVHNLNDLQRISIYYHELDRLGPDRRKSVVAWRRRHDRFLGDLIRTAQDEGYADSAVDAQLLANCVFATIIWPYRWFRADHDGTAESIADACTDFVMRGVAGEVPAAGF
jgi:TetR/AcrR family transcriptional regulator, cholesterol catabolism regulator